MSDSAHLPSEVVLLQLAPGSRSNGQKEQKLKAMLAETRACGPGTLG
ncbi:MAG TPA: hypothetical protein VGD98_26010 [Ktedonobacteraceae bacterium]